MIHCEPSTDRRPNRFWREREFWLIAIVVAGMYFSRLDALPIRGEEPRRARVAYEMLARGDWVVPRQQGEIYLSRPPLGNWLIAAVGFLRGDIDAVAVRLPSGMAIVLTVLLIYGYCRCWLSRLGAFAAGAAFATSVMVIELGRLGETEAVFTLCVSASLLTWHWGYQRAWHPAIVSGLGFALAALAGLAKGPQGPLYFGAPVLAYLLLRRDWRYLCSPWQACGLLTFVAVLGAWQVPFLLATDWQSVRGIWLSNAAERFDDPSWSRLVTHLVTYPAELFACLLPWSLPLAYLANRKFWRSLADVRPWALFSLVAIGVCFPSVWLASGAKGRYFMPLFPMFAVLAGLVIERCWQAERAAAPRRAWNLFLAAITCVAVAAGVSIGLAGAVGLGQATPLAQPPLFSAVFALAAFVCACCVWRGRSDAGAAWGVTGLTSLMLVVALGTAGVATNIRKAACEDTAGVIARLKAQLPADAELVSLGQISHLFAYHYGGILRTSPWPSASEPLAADIEYFCFNEFEGESFDFPFAWERVAVIALDRTRRAVPERTVVVARRIGGSPLASSDDP